MSFEAQPDAKWFVRESPIFVNRFSEPGRVRHDPGNTTFEDHYHEFHEFVLIHRGHAVHCINGRETGAYPGEVFLIKPGMRHHFQDADGLTLTNLMFIGWRLTELLEELREMPGFAALFLLDATDEPGQDDLSRVVLNADEQSVAREITDRMLAESKRKAPGYKSALRGMLTELMVLLARARLSAGNVCSEPAHRIAVLVSALTERFFEDWPLARMAEVAGCSVPSLSRHFRAQMRTSPTEYLISLRLSRARQLLLNTDLSVTNIADQTGFADPNYFTRQFRSRTGITPRQYRQGIMPTMPA